MDAGTILVVDDETDIRETVAEILRDEGYRVCTAANGAEALLAMEHHVPAAVLLDMRMPVLDGRGFARAIKERGIHLPILVMTAARDAQRWCDEIGAQYCLPKPFDLLDVLETVERAAGPPPPG